MSIDPGPQPRLNVRPPIIILAFVLLFTLLPGQFFPRSRFHFGSLVGSWLIGIVATVIWWIFRSRVRGAMRWMPVLILIMIAGLGFALYPGMNLGLRPLLCILGTVLVWNLTAILTSLLSWAVQRAAILSAMSICLVLTGAVRIDGTDTDLVPELSWRWTKTNEQKAFESIERSTGPVEPAALAVKPGDWPQFRGLNQDSRLEGTSIRTDWSAQPPKELWRVLVGPGWGAVTVVGDFVFTHEQRLENEAVVCRSVSDGKEVWNWLTKARFAEAISGVGPRATPTFHQGSIYAFGATGKLCRLDARTGKELWVVDTPQVTGTTPPPAFWGYASSPLVTHGFVVVFINGASGKGTAAFRTEDGSLAWTAGDGSHGYCMAHRAILAGTEQLLMPSNFGLESIDPATGKLLWQYSWSTSANRSTQPILLGNDELLLPTGYSVGTRSLKVSGGTSTGWTVTPGEPSRQLRPYYNDAVLHDGVVFGFNDSAFVCFDPKTGRNKWSAGSRYGFGQVLLLADQKMLLIQSESGNVSLVEANPREYVELARFKALTGKTWNHPVIAHGKLFVRNGQEMACFDVAPK